jgi:hypothetical protein
LGDAQVVAESAMYNLYSPTVWELFMEEIRYGQETNTSNQYYGFVPEVVPSALLGVPKPPPAKGQPGDISWTAAYPLIAHWLLQYYGDEAVVRDHWAQMKLWVDAQKREMKPGDGVPCIYIHGDWCAPFEPRSIAMKGTGPAAAASNYILAGE